MELLLDTDCTDCGARGASCPPYAPMPPVTPPSPPLYPSSSICGARPRVASATSPAPSLGLSNQGFDGTLATWPFPDHARQRSLAHPKHSSHVRSSLARPFTHAHPMSIRHSLVHSHILKHLSEALRALFSIAHVFPPLHHRNTDVSSLVRHLPGASRTATASAVRILDSQGPLSPLPIAAAAFAGVSCCCCA